MTGFEYLIALASVVAGLGLTRALSGFAKIIHMRGLVKVSDINVIWTLTILLWLISYWWFTFSLTAIAQWDIPLFLFVLVYGALIFFLIALLFIHGRLAISGHYRGCCDQTHCSKVARLSLVCHSHFKCNPCHISGYANLTKKVSF